MNSPHTLKGLVAPQNFLVREEPIRRMERIVFALLEAARHGEASAGTIIKALEVALWAQCPCCALRVSGVDLLKFARLPVEEEPVGIQRLRQGLCAREGCDFNHYILTFQTHPDIDWARLMSSGEEINEQRAVRAEKQLEAAAEEESYRSERRRLLTRLAILLVAALLALMLRQLYFGGRIPLIREPEKFRVDPAPPGSERIRRGH